MRTYNNPHTVQLTLIQDELKYTVKEIHEIFADLSSAIWLSKDVLKVKKLSKELSDNYTYMYDYYTDFVTILGLLEAENTGDPYVMKIIESREGAEMNFKSVSRRVVAVLKESRVFIRSKFISRQTLTP